MPATTFIPNNIPSLIGFGTFKEEDLIDGKYSFSEYLIANISEDDKYTLSPTVILIGKGPNHNRQYTDSENNTRICIDLLVYIYNYSKTQGFITPCEITSRSGVDHITGISSTITDNKIKVDIDFSNNQDFNRDGFEYRYLIYQGAATVTVPSKKGGLLSGIKGIYAKKSGTDRGTNFTYSIINKLSSTTVFPCDGNLYSAWEVVSSGVVKLITPTNTYTSMNIPDWEFRTSILPRRLLHESGVIYFGLDVSGQLPNIRRVYIYWPGWLTGSDKKLIRTCYDTAYVDDSYSYSIVNTSTAFATRSGSNTENRSSQRFATFLVNENYLHKEGN